MITSTPAQCPIRGRHTRRRGVTLVELVVASSLMTIISAGIFTLFIAVLRQERSNIAELRMAYEAAALHRDLRRVAGLGANISSVGNTVQFTNVETGVVSQLRWVNEDGDWDTIGDNYIELVMDMEAPEQTRRVVQFISPLTIDGDQVPIFQRLAGSPAPISVNFRIGDRPSPRNRVERASDPVAVADDAFTGPGRQTFVFRGVYSPRIR